MARYGTVVDLRKCQGCRTCTVTCKMANNTPKGINWIQLVKHEVGEYPNVSVEFYPKQCMQCGDPPCVDVCPTGATYQRDDGIVIVDGTKCMGCAYCVIACPYDARQKMTKLQGYDPNVKLTDEEKKKYAKLVVGTNTKCNFCVDLVERGEVPVCIRTCPTFARYFGDLDDPNSEVSKLIAQRHGYQLMPELGTDPSVYYLPV
jgi:Fe-S-cluster-containing dehydrogenase component